MIIKNQPPASTVWNNMIALQCCSVACSVADSGGCGPAKLSHNLDGSQMCRLLNFSE
jgi:hypothetical protein